MTSEMPNYFENVLFQTFLTKEVIYFLQIDMQDMINVYEK